MKKVSDYVSKDIKLKEVKNSVINNNITNINDIVGKNKNITIEATLIAYKIFKLNNTTTTILNLRDGTGDITGLFVGEYDNPSNNNIYKIRGNVVLIEDINLDEFNQLINDDIKKYIIDNKLFCVTSIQPINNNQLINLIELSLYHNNCDDLIHLQIPISAIEILEINKISSSIIYLKNGKYDEINVCDNLEIRLSVDKLENEIIKTLLENICIFTIGLFFANGDKRYYNLPYHSCDGSKNELQRINKKDSKIFILVDEELKYGKFEK